MRDDVVEPILIRDEKLIFIGYQMLVIGWIAGNDWRPQSF
jgi:hypothetical protein